MRDLNNEAVRRWRTRSKEIKTEVMEENKRLCDDLKKLIARVEVLEQTQNRIQEEQDRIKKELSLENVVHQIKMKKI